MRRSPRSATTSVTRTSRRTQEKDLSETLGGDRRQGRRSTSSAATRTPDEIFILLLVLFTLGGVLMLGGTLTATFLALSDARPDLATLSAVGAAPRSRRGVAASYALVVGFVGAVLGRAGRVHPRHRDHLSADRADPGLCSSSASGAFACETSGPFLDIPWLMILGLVVALPLLTGR